MTSARWLLRLEGLALAVLAGALVWQSGPPLWLWAVVLIAPDLSFAAYLAGPVVGAAAYNLVHTTIGPLILGGMGLFAGERRWVEVAMLWLVHVGVDRTLGFGLKLPTGFKDTHLGSLGRDG